MKKIVIVICTLCIAYLSSAQVNDTVKVKSGPKKFVEVEENYEGTKVSVGKNEYVKVEEKRDTVRVKIGKKGIRVVEEGDKTTVDVIDVDDDIFEEEFGKINTKFKGHWAGFELGVNTYVKDGFSFGLPEDEQFMELNTTKSTNVNINFIQYSLGIANDRFGLVTGLGLQMNNYRFDNNNSITEVDGVIVELPYPENLSKSKLSMTYLTAPVMFEAQFGDSKKRSRRLHVAAGVIGGLHLRSHTKVMYKDAGKKIKDKARDDFNLNPFTYGVVFRMGYRAINLYANYNFSSLFKKDQGPELYPFTVGITLVHF